VSLLSQACCSSSVPKSGGAEPRQWQRCKLRAPLTRSARMLSMHRLPECRPILKGLTWRKDAKWFSCQYLRRCALQQGSRHQDALRHQLRFGHFSALPPRPLAPAICRLTFINPVLPRRRRRRAAWHGRLGHMPSLRVTWRGPPAVARSGLCGQTGGGMIPIGLGQRPPTRWFKANGGQRLANGGQKLWPAIGRVPIDHPQEARTGGSTAEHTPSGRQMRGLPRQTYTPPGPEGNSDPRRGPTCGLLGLSRLRKPQWQELRRLTSPIADPKSLRRMSSNQSECERRYLRHPFRRRFLDVFRGTPVTFLGTLRHPRPAESHRPPRATRRPECHARPSQRGSRRVLGLLASVARQRRYGHRLGSGFFWQQASQTQHKLQRTPESPL